MSGKTVKRRQTKLRQEGKRTTGKELEHIYKLRSTENSGTALFFSGFINLLRKKEVIRII